MKLVPDWKSAWKWHSTQLMVAVAALPVVWVNLPEDAKAMIPAGAEPWIPTALAVAAIIGRLRAQP